MIKLCAFADEAADSLDGQIIALKRNGINLIELRSVDGKNVVDFTESEAHEYAERLKSEGISVWSIGSPLGKSDIEEDEAVYFARLHKLCKTAEIFNCGNIRAFSFFNAYDKRDEVMKRLEETVKIARKYGIKICHENEKDIYGDTLKRTLDIINSVDGIYSVYDPANFIQCGEEAGETISALFEKTYYFHVKDVIKETGEIVPAGYGNGKIDEIVKGVKNDTVFTIEPHLALFKGYSSIDKTEMKNKFNFANSSEAFDCAVRAFKDILFGAGYKETARGFEK